MSHPASAASDTIEFHCTGCGRALKVPASAAGKRASCPQCNAVVQVPLASHAPPASAAMDGNRARQPVPSPSSAGSAWAMPPQPPAAPPPIEPSAPEIGGEKSEPPTSDLQPPTPESRPPTPGPEVRETPTKQLFDRIT